jgi:hypothetical protein
MTPARIVLVAALLVLVTPAAAATTRKADNRDVSGICEQGLKAQSFAAVAKPRVVGCHCAHVRGKIADSSWPANGKRLAHRHAVKLTRNRTPNSSTPS